MIRLQYRNVGLHVVEARFDFLNRGPISNRVLSVGERLSITSNFPEADEVCVRARAYHKSTSLLHY